MKFITINTTSFNKDSIIGVEMPTKDIDDDDNPTGKWFYIVYIKDAIEEIVAFDNAEECIKSRSELMSELESPYMDVPVEISELLLDGLSDEDLIKLKGMVDGEAEKRNKTE